jgi:hypothetical protein
LKETCGARDKGRRQPCYVEMENEAKQVSFKRNQNGIGLSA